MSGELGKVTGGNDAQVIVDTATAAAGERELDVAMVYGVTLPEGAEHQFVDPEEFAPFPRRKRGGRVVYTPGSLIEYVLAHAPDDKDGDTTLWGDVETSTIVALLNDHQAGVAGWGDHRATLTLRHPPAWKRWIGLNGKLVDQQQFAEHIEQSLPEVVEPDGATMLEIAQSFLATRSVEFKSDQRLTSGQVKLQYEETIAARAGAKGDLQVPQEITVALSPYEGMDAFRITARLRFRINDGDLRVGYVLDRPEELLRAAFNEVVETVGSGTGITVWHGKP